MDIFPKIVYLSKNYRSTNEIVNFCNNFVKLDSKFQSSRVKNKPLIIEARSKPYNNYPVLGMFRDDIETLGNDLAEFVYNVVEGNGYDLLNGEYSIKIDPDGGSPSDIALLCSSPRERGFNKQPRLPQ